MKTNRKRPSNFSVSAGMKCVRHSASRDQVKSKESKLNLKADGHYRKRFRYGGVHNAVNFS
jgi:hypothetical protein